MDVGTQHFFPSYGWENISDGQVYADEVELALMAEDLGFDVVWAVEHHFEDYSFCPDNTQLLSYIAGKTSRIDVGTAAIIMPWNEPMRVAEKIALLDELSDGRVRFGIGRGLSRHEYGRMRGIEMSESRERFDEGSVMVMEALETGTISGDGPFYPQEPAPIRPAPSRSFAGRTYAVASSDDSIESCARLGAAMVMFADRSWTRRLPSIERWRELHREFHDTPPPTPLVCDFIYCHEDEAVAKQRAEDHLAIYLASVLSHYEIMGDHFADLKGYDAYAAASGALNKMGESGFLAGFLEATAYGTPAQIIETLSARRDLIGDFEFAPAFRFGGLPQDQAIESMKLFASDVLPTLHSWS